MRSGTRHCRSSWTDGCPCEGLDVKPADKRADNPADKASEEKHNDIKSEISFASQDFETAKGDESEDYYSGADDAHGAGGELRVENQRLRWEILDAWRDAAVAAGLPATDDFNR